MGASIPTPLDVAASIDRVLRRNIQWPTRNVVFADSPVTVTTFDRSIFADAVGGAMVVNLPDATLNRGMFFEIKKTDISVNTVTIQCTVGGQTIDAAGAKVLIATNDFIVVESDGANYKIVALVISAPAGGGAVFYTVNKIVKTDGIATLVPVDGTLIPFNVAVDGECSFWAAGIWTGFSPGVAAGSLNFRIDGVDYAPLSWGWNNGSGGDFTSSESLSPHISLFLTAGPHTVELVASNTVLGLNASPANPLTLSVLFPAASFSTAAPTPKAATFVVHPVPGVGDFTTIEAALAALVPLGGGYILAREGTYTPPAGGYVQPNVPVVLRGCGPNTIIDLGAVGDPAFLVGFAQSLVIEHLAITGTAADVNRRVVSISAAAFVKLHNLTGSNLRTVVEVTGGAAANVEVAHSDFTLLTNAASTFITANAATVVRAVEVSVIGAANSGGILGTPKVELLGVSLTVVNTALLGADSVLTGCTFTGTAGETVSLLARTKVDACRFVAVTVLAAGDSIAIVASIFSGSAAQARALDITATAGPQITGCTFTGCTTDLIRVNAAALDTNIAACTFIDAGAIPRAIDILAAAFRVTVIGCAFQFFTTEAIQIAGGRCNVVGNSGCRVVELIATANLNRYAANDGFDPSAITGGASLIENENVTETAVDTLLDEFRRTVLVDATAAARTITLPTAASAKWRIYTIKKIDASLNTVTIDGDGAETIDGAATQLLLVQYQSITIQSDGAEWWIL